MSYGGVLLCSTPRVTSRIWYVDPPPSSSGPFSLPKDLWFAPSYDSIAVVPSAPTRVIFHLPSVHHSTSTLDFIVPRSSLSPLTPASCNSTHYSAAPTGIPTKPNGGNHTREFAASAATVEAHKATLNVSKALAAVSVRLLTDEDFLNEVGVPVATFYPISICVPHLSSACVGACISMLR